ncbi:Hamartin protein-domain-containing protein [Hysterangium stoloniferum]|nr:Hamartin protein-domain-containing protein [Hysterangium stoloniferum]
MSSNISQRIRVALAKGSSSKGLSEALSEALVSIDAFVRKHSEEDQAALNQLRDELQSMYKDLVDHSSSANVEAFLAILHAFLPIFRPIYAITDWWDLVLRAALRDPRLSAGAQQEAKTITLHALIHDSPKVGEFRKRIMELFLLDAYDESSGSDALEQATMSSEEQRAQQTWKRNLGDILEQYCIQKPQDFLDGIHAFFAAPRRRLKLSVLLGDILRSEHFPVKEFAAHPMLDSFLLSLVVDGSSTLFEVEIATLVTLLPQFAIHALETLIRILPYCYAILARVMCWKQRSRTADLLEREVSCSDTSSQSRVSDPELDSAHTPPIRHDVRWERLNATFVSSVSNPPSPLYLFSTLYGLYPCNIIAFLRGPAGYLAKAGLKSPFREDWPEVIDEDQIRTRSRAILRHNILHPSILVHTAQSELEERNRWLGWTVPHLVMTCTMLDVRNAALSLPLMPDAFSLPDSHDTATENVTVKSTLSGDNSPQVPDDKVFIDLRGTDFSSGRLRVSVQDILATYHALKSGAEIDISDPIPSWPSAIFPSTVPISTDATALKATAPDGPVVTAMPLHEEVISSLQRETLLLRTELNYELWLKREHVKRIGSLYLDRILVKGAEEERQSLHNKLKEFKSKVHQLEKTLAKEQAGAATMKAQHHGYTDILQTRLKAERAEKQKWNEEKSRLQSEYSNLKAMLEAQATRLADATENVFKLETMIKENAPKVQRLKDYEDKISQMTKSQRLWDEDVQHLKEQAAYLDELRSRYRNKLLLIESYENANHELALTIDSLRNRISALEARAPPPRPRPEPSQEIYEMMETLRTRVSSLTVERDALKENNDQLCDQMEELRVEAEALRVSTRPGTLASALKAT